MRKKHSSHDFKSLLYEVIFEADTRAGKNFDVILLILILLSLIVVMLETVPSVQDRYANKLYIAEWVITGLFIVEYLVRIYCSPNRSKYLFSFYGWVDLFSILPTFIGLLFTGTQYLITIRALRLLRVFRILKLSTYLIESQVLVSALKSSRHKITVFLATVLIIISIVGSAMYLIEGGQDSSFNSIPISIYWAIVTVTTVGYGDITPTTPLGQFISAILMILGYAILAVPTGIVSVELAYATQQQKYMTPKECPHCNPSDHDIDAAYCKFCGSKI